jgi:hypothetical protein
MRGRLMHCEEEGEDDRFPRWCAVNGITHANFDAKRADGTSYVAYFREDGSEVDAATSYPYDAVLTPYTHSAGRA